MLPLMMSLWLAVELRRSLVLMRVCVHQRARSYDCEREICPVTDEQLSAVQRESFSFPYRQMPLSWQLN